MSEAPMRVLMAYAGRFMFSSVIASGRFHQFTSVVRLPTCAAVHIKL